MVNQTKGGEGKRREEKKKKNGLLEVMALERASGGPDNVSVVLIKTAVSSVQID